MKKYELAGIALETPLIAAAGTINGTDETAILNDVRALSQTELGALTIGSFTAERQEGNEVLYGSKINNYNRSTGALYYADGMPNIGIAAARRLLPQVVEIAHSAGKPVIASVNPTYETEGVNSSAKQTGQMVYKMLTAGVDLIEINLSHQVVRPDKHGAVIIEPVLGYEPEQVQAIIDNVALTVGNLHKIGIKLPPYITQQRQKFMPEIAKAIIGTQSSLGYIATAGAIPNRVPLRTNKDFLLTGAPGGIGSQSGPITKGIGFGELNKWKKLTEDSNIDILSMLGVNTGVELARRMKAGAAAVGGVTFMYGIPYREEGVSRMIKQWTDATGPEE